MRIVLDENLPVVLKSLFSSPHSAATVHELGLSGKSNGELLRALEGAFDVFVTADKRLKYQQNLVGRSLAIVELPTNRLPLLIPHFSEISTAILAVSAGEYKVLILS